MYIVYVQKTEQKQRDGTMAGHSCVATYNEFLRNRLPVPECSNSEEAPKRLVERNVGQPSGSSGHGDVARRGSEHFTFSVPASLGAHRTAHAGTSSGFFAVKRWKIAERAPL